jgi:hypothetical protein
VNTAYTARDVREAQRVARGKSLDLASMADDLVRNAPPFAIDRAAYEHAIRLAALLRNDSKLWAEIAAVRGKYAAELEQEQGAGSKPTRGKSSLLTSRPERTADPIRVGVGLGWCTS